MKKVCIFIGGVVTGAILVVVVSMLIAGGNSTYKGITLFEKEGECISLTCNWNCYFVFYSKKQ